MISSLPKVCVPRSVSSPIWRSSKKRSARVGLTVPGASHSAGDGLARLLRRGGVRRGARVAPADQLVGAPVGRHLALLIEKLDQHLGDADVRPRREVALLEHRVAAGDRVAGTHRHHPAALVDTGRAERGDAVEQTVGHHPHHHGAGVPARRAQAADQRVLGRLLVDVNGLGIVGATVGEDLLLGHGLGAQIVVGLADLDILVMQLLAARKFVLHAPASPPDCGRRLSYRLGRALSAHGNAMHGAAWAQGGTRARRSMQPLNRPPG